MVRAPSGRYLHHNFVVAVLNDLFGIQSRGGCSCAGPYGHRLLGIDIERSHEFEREITGGCEGIKPGWVRVNFNYFLSDAVADYIVEAVRLVARDGWRLLPDYHFDTDHRALDPPRGRGRAAAAAGRDHLRRATGCTRRPRGARATSRCWRSTWTTGSGCSRGRRARPHSPDLDERRLRAPAVVRPAGLRGDSGRDAYLNLT